MNHALFPKYLRFLAPLRLSLDGDGAAGGGVLTGDASASGGGGSAGGGADAGAGNAGVAPAPDFRSYLNPDGTFAKPDWAGEEKSLAEKFTSLPNLIKSYRSLERMNSNGNKVAIPSETSTKEEWNAYYAKLGRPETPDGYEIKMPEKIGDKPFPKELWSEERAKGFAQWAHEKGFSKNQVAALIEYDAKRGMGDMEAVQADKKQRMDSALGELAKEWGPADGTKFKANVALAERGAAVVGLSAEVLQTNPELSNNPYFIKAMAKVAQMTNEQPAANSRNDGGQIGQGVDTQIRAIMNDKSHPYHVKGHPDHARAVKEMEGLFLKKHAGQG